MLDRKHTAMGTPEAFFDQAQCRTALPRTERLTHAEFKSPQALTHDSLPKHETPQISTQAESAALFSAIDQPVFQYSNGSTNYFRFISYANSDHPVWYYYEIPEYNEEVSRLDRKNKETYKLHISIHPNAFDQSKNIIHHLLHQAIDLRIFIGYKTYAVATDADERQRHAPFTIYLDFVDDINLAKVAELCFKIENALKDTPAGDNDVRARCDIAFSNHIIFRQESLQGVYVSARAPDTALVDQLLDEGAHSECLRKLRLYYSRATLSSNLKSLQTSYPQCMFSTSKVSEPSVDAKKTCCVTM